MTESWIRMVVNLSFRKELNIFFEKRVVCLLRKPSLNSNILYNYYLISSFFWGKLYSRFLPWTWDPWRSRLSRPISLLAQYRKGIVLLISDFWWDRKVIILIRLGFSSFQNLLVIILSFSKHQEWGALYYIVLIPERIEAVVRAKLSSRPFYWWLLQSLIWSYSTWN